MKRKSQTPRMPKDCREVQKAMDRASWDAIEGYRRQALADDLVWIARGREASGLSHPSCQKRSSK